MSKKSKKEGNKEGSSYRDIVLEIKEEGIRKGQSKSTLQSLISPSASKDCNPFIWIPNQFLESQFKT